jgi:hypothetical protein
MNYYLTSNLAIVIDLSEKYYKLAYPEGSVVQTKYLFSWLTSSTESNVVICIDNTQVIPTYQKSDLSTFLNDVKLAFNLSQNEIRRIENKILTGSSTIRELLPQNITELTVNQLISRGFLPASPNFPF